MTARTGQANLITRLRGMTQAGTAEYTIGATTWWTDDQLADVLALYATHYNRASLIPQPEYAGGTARYHDYYAPRGELEEAASGTIYWSVEDSNGDEAGTANYSVDYVAGLVRFSADQGGTAYYLRGRAYNLSAAAAHIWREKAGWRAQYVTFDADDQRLNQSDWFKHCMRMVDYYTSAISLAEHRLRRSDLT